MFAQGSKKPVVALCSALALLFASIAMAASPTIRSQQAESRFQNQTENPQPIYVEPQTILPMPGSFDDRAFRGVLPPGECVFEPCEINIYENSGGTSATNIGDIICDDVSFAVGSTERFICSVSVVAGGLNNTGGAIPLTLIFRSGNATPDCPDSPNSLILFEAVQNLATTNPFNVVTFNIDPPILLNENFVWVCLSIDPDIITPENEDFAADASWSIAGPAETGTTIDSFVIPNGDGVCFGGAGGDYFFFGGDPIAGFGVLVTANPGPPGACCDRDTDDGMGNGTCTDGVLRADCLVGTTQLWKDDLCANFDMAAPVCNLCPSDVDLCDGADAEGEDDCSAGYQDMFNQGCLEAPFMFSAIDCSDAICGTSGNYNSFCTEDSECNQPETCDTLTMSCTGPPDDRDNDWYLLTLTAETEVTVTYTARFPAQISLMNSGGGDPAANCPAGAVSFLDFDNGRACDVLTITRCLPAGQWMFRTRPDTFAGIPCDTTYRIEVACAACPMALPIGACCNSSVMGCEEVAEIRCEGAGLANTWLGEGTTCAVEGMDCAGVPDNDECTTKELLTGDALSIAVDTSFATNSTSPPDTPADCAFFEPLAPNVPITNDIFYNYLIPTMFGGEAVTAGDLIISTVGSSVLDGKIVVYGDPGEVAGVACGAALCSAPQIACNDQALFDETIAVKFRTEAYVVLPVEDGSTDFLDPGDCIKIRLGGGEGAGNVLFAQPNGPGLLNIDFIPRSTPFSLDTVRCCFDNGTCTIETTSMDCETAGGFPRAVTDFYEGETTNSEFVAGCNTDPCPQPGDACFNGQLFNDLAGGFEGTVTRTAVDVVYYKYTLPASGGVVIDTCGGFGGILAIYSDVTFSGDCDLASQVALNDNCTADSSIANGALTTSTCYSGINGTGNSCVCLTIGDPGVPADGTIYIAIGADPEGLFDTSSRDVVDIISENQGPPATARLNITTLPGGCFICPADCPMGATIEGEAECADTVDPEPQDLYNGGCLATPPSFNGPSIDCSGGPVTICGKTGNFDHPFPCDAPTDCPNAVPCSGVNGFCIGGTQFVDRDEDWYQIVVDVPSVISYKLLNSQTPPEISILFDDGNDCENLLAITGSDDFGCDPPAGDPVSFEISASVCAGTYYLRVTASIFGGLGEAACDSAYVVEASCEPFQASDCCAGDMNGDGLVNGRDIQKWIDTLFIPPTFFDDFLGCFDANFCRADVDPNGLVEMADLPVFVDLLVGPSKPVCPEAPACGDAATSQLPFDNMGATMSDLDVSDDRRAADCFCPLEDGSIDTVCWWGTYLDFSLAECAAEDDCFQINFYETTANRCPGARICAAGLSEPACSQFVGGANRVVSGAIITPAAIVTEFFYTATLPNPLQVTAGECVWLEVTNLTTESECKWHWEQSSQGDTRHAVVDVDPPTSELPSDYTACTAANIAARDLAFSVNVRIAKDGCGKPVGRCCHDDPPLGTLDCEITTEEICVAVLNGEWSEDGTCGPADPACTVGRCCYLDPLTTCVETLQSTCANVLGGLWVEGASCPCPTGRCCVGPICSINVSEVACLDQGGIWLEGANCANPCPTGICNDIGRCQLPNVTNGQQQGGYVSDIDDDAIIADDFRPLFTGGGALNYVDQICWRGFHRVTDSSNNDCLNLVTDVETFTITYYASSGNLPDTGTIIGGPFNVTPVKSEPVPAEGVAGGGVQFQYEAFHAQVPVTPSACLWVEIQNTTASPTCTWLWATSNEGGNNKAAIDGPTFPYQLVDRDLSYCLGPVNLGSASCAFSPAAPANDQCVNAIALGVGPQGPVTGTTIGALKDPGSSSSCGNTANAGDVWYTWTQGGVAVPTTFLTCFINTTFDTVMSIHKTVGLPNGGCPGTGASASQISLLAQGCQDDGCPAGIGTNILFFQGRQTRIQVNSTALLPANTTFLIRVSGALKGGTSNNTPNGLFTLEVAQ